MLHEREDMQGLLKLIDDSKRNVKDLTTCIEVEYLNKLVVKIINARIEVLKGQLGSIRPRVNVQRSNG